MYVGLNVCTYVQHVSVCLYLYLGIWVCTCKVWQITKDSGYERTALSISHRVHGVQGHFLSCLHNLIWIGSLAHVVTGYDPININQKSPVKHQP